MWPAQFEHRLQEWNDLRSQCANLDTETALMHINDWWFRVPTINRYLHWDDWNHWPDPWQLLADDYYCEVARALGIVYTVQMTDIQLESMQLAQCNEGVLVQIDHGKYILNWAPGDLLNISSYHFNITKTLDTDVFQDRTT